MEAFGELVRGDPAVVVVRDSLDRFVDDARLVVGDERVAQEARQVFGVPAQPQARDEQDREQHRERDREGVSLRVRGHCAAGKRRAGAAPGGPARERPC